MITPGNFLKWCYVFKVFNQSGGGGGTVTNIGSGVGLTGGPITTSGTLSFAPIPANTLWANNTGLTAVPTPITFATLASGLGFGTMANQNANSVNITGGSATLGTLRAPYNVVAVTANTNLPANTSRTLFEVTSASVVTITDAAGLATYGNGTYFKIKNSGTSNVVFQPFGSETIDGLTSLTILPGYSYEIAKGSVNTIWRIVSFYQLPVTNSNTALNNGVFGASTTALSGWTYNNGVAGVGATLTAPGSGVFAADGFTIPVGERWLYKDDSAGGGAYNGVYVVTVSSAGAPAVLTRAMDYNSTANMLNGRVLTTRNGVANGGSVFMQGDPVTVVGTTTFNYVLLFAVDQYVKRSGDSMLGALDMGGFALTNLTTPVNPNDAASKAYVDAASSSGVVPVNGAFGASTAPLSGWTYNNGTAGVGATLTAPGNGVFNADGFTIPVGQRWLYKDDSAGSGAYNGIYTVTISSAGAPAVLTRATDYNSVSNMLAGRTFTIRNGLANGGSQFMQQDPVVTVGTTPVGYSLMFAVSLYAQTTNNLSDLANIATARTNLGLGNAALKTPSDNSLAILASVDGVTTANRLAIFSDTTGTVRNAPTSTATPVTLVNPLIITPAINTQGLTLNGIVSGFNTSARIDINSTTAGLTRSIISMGNPSINVCQILYDQTNGPVGLSFFFQSLATQVLNINHTTGDTNLFFKTIVGDKVGTLASNTPLLTVQGTGGTSSNQMPLIQVLNKQTSTTQNGAGVLMGGSTTATQSIFGSDTINSGGAFIRSLAGSIGDMLNFNNATGTATFPYAVQVLGQMVVTGAFTGATATLNRVTLATQGTTAAQSFGWTSPNAYPTWGSAPVVIQNGSVTPGNIATWNATGQLQDGGAAPGVQVRLRVLTATTSTVFTPTAGTKYMSLVVIGAGGGAGNTTTATSCSSGGDSGAMVYTTLAAQSFTYTCGVGGAGSPAGTAAPGLGSTGGSTIITGLTGGTITCTGGLGGQLGTTVSSFAAKTNVSNNPTGGQIQIDPTPGDRGILYASSFLQGGDGGGTPYGPGGPGAVASALSVAAQGRNGFLFGGGGGGSVTTAGGAAQKGGDGANGGILVYEYA